MEYNFKYISNYQLEKFNDIISAIIYLERIIHSREYDYKKYGENIINNLNKLIFQKHVDLSSFKKTLREYLYNTELKNHSIIIDNLVFYLHNILLNENIELDIKHLIYQEINRYFYNVNYPITKYDLLENINLDNLRILKGSIIKYIDQISILYLEDFIDILNDIKSLENYYSIKSRLIDDLINFLVAIKNNFEYMQKIIKKFKDLTNVEYLSIFINNNTNNFTVNNEIYEIKNKEYSLINLFNNISNKLLTTEINKEVLEDLEYIIQNSSTNTITVINNADTKDKQKFKRKIFL